MSRHHPYSGYDESSHSGNGYRKKGFGNRTINVRGNGFGGRAARRGGGAGGGGGGGGHHGFRGGSHSSSAGSNKSSWDSSILPGLDHPHHKSFNHKNIHPNRSFEPERDLSIDERIQRERPCRTLFVRNVKYETDSQEVRDKFEQMGEIKIFFDLISTRGMAFITYYDLRAAKMAKERLQGTEVSGRPIDVHYSLPKDNELQRRCDRDKNQATLLVSINDASRQINEGELRTKFETYGEIRSIKALKDSPYQRFVEYWDTRACESAHDSLAGSHYLGGQLELKFAWDTGMVPKGRPDWRAGQDDDRGEFYGPDEGQDYYEHDDDYTRDNGHQDYHQGDKNTYGSHNMGQPLIPFGKKIDEQRLDQAHKVQELLESLTKAGSDAHSAAAPMVNNYPTEPSVQKQVGQSGFITSNQRPSNFVPNYPTYPVAPPADYSTNPIAPSNPATQSYSQLAQIMGQLSSFSASTPVQQQPLVQSHPSNPTLNYPSTNEDSRRLSGSGTASISLGLPPSILSLLQQNASTNSSLTSVPQPHASYTQQSNPSPAIPTAPRAMQAAAAIASLASPSSHSQNPLPTPPISQYTSTPVVPNNTSNPQTAVQQLLALLQQQQQQQQQKQHPQHQ